MTTFDNCDKKFEAAISVSRNKEIRKQKSNNNSPEAIINELEKYRVALRRQREELLKTKNTAQEAADKYKMIVELANDAFFQGDSNGNFITVNNATSELTGYSREKLLTMNMKDLFSKSQLNDKPLRYDLLTQGETLKVERELIKSDGSTIIVEMNSKKMTNNTYQAFIRDITLLRRAEKALQDREFLFRTFIDYTFDWEYWEAEDKSIIYMSPSCERITGYTANEFMANPELLTKIVHEDDLKIYANHHEKYHSKEYSDFSEIIVFRVISKDFSYSYIEHVCRPVYDENENYLGRRISNRDITEQKWAEDEIRQAKDEQEQKLKKDIVNKEIQLAKLAKALQDKDDYLMIVHNLFEQVRAGNLPKSRDINQIGNKLGTNILSNSEEWLQLEEDFFRINPMFMSKLSVSFPNLTNTELRICAMIKLNMRSKEIANILNISQKTVDNHRLSIRKKLINNESMQLSCFLMQY